VIQAMLLNDRSLLAASDGSSRVTKEAQLSISCTMHYWHERYQGFRLDHGRSAARIILTGDLTWVFMG
jgi:hypothetical protein